MLKQPENSDQNRKVDQASVPMSGNPEVEPNGEPSPSLVKVKQAPVRPRGYLKAEQTFLEIIGERFCNQGQVAKCGYSVHRYTEIADKFVRVVQEHFSGKIPSNLPKDSSVYRDNRLLSMLNSVEYFPSTKLNYNERTELIRDNLSIVYRFARERFFL